jgi:hypothetical protein
MPFTPFLSQGTLPNYDLKEFDDTGLLVMGCSFTPRQMIKEKTGHKAGQLGYNRILQVQFHAQVLDLELKGEIVPDANGLAVGLGNVYSGQSVAIANFSATDATLVIHGYSRDAAKFLAVKEVKRETDPEKAPTVTVPLTYYPDIDAPVA